MAVPAFQIEQLANYIRTKYIYERRVFETSKTGVPSTYGKGNMDTWDGGIDKKGVNKPNIWLKIAKVVINNELDPDILVHLLFSNHNGYSAPTPNMMLNQELLELAKKEKDIILQQLQLAIKLEMEKLVMIANEVRETTKVNEDVALRAALNSPSMEISPLVRYCMAVSSNNFDVADKYFNQAVIQYMSKKSLYDKVLGEIIPDELRYSNFESGDEYVDQYQN